MTADRRFNPPGTADTKENTDGGILIVMPPGFGPLKTSESEEGELPAAGLITSRTVDRGPAVSSLLQWLTQSNFPVRDEKRAFSIFVWPSVSMKDSHGPQQIPVLVSHGDEIIGEIGKRKPQIVIFLSCYLFDAFGDQDIQEKILKILGKPLEKPRRITATRLRTLFVRYERALILGLPIPGRNTAGRFESELAEGLSAVFEEAGIVRRGF